MTGHIKIAFPCTGPGGEQETETMWATAVVDGYQVDNIPFYATGLACGDVVSAQPQLDGMLRFVGLTRSGGHTTVRVVIPEPKKVGEVRAALRALGCESEGSDVPCLVAVDVPPDVRYSDVRALLDRLLAEAVLDYEEACLGQADD
ncbi:MAG: DUF4265 domain-containing protein [Myxococcales bacterium]|nr:DUF4265 domain-containing protein [Myxococcales bacterium]